MKKHFLSFMALLFCQTILDAQNAPPIEWQKSLGGLQNEYAQSIQQTIEGGFVVAGYSQSNDGDVSGNHGISDYWIAKLDSAGNIQWEKSFGGSSGEYCQSIQQTTDNGFILAGRSFSNDGDVSGNHGSADVWIVKLDSAGNIQWQKALGGSSIEYGCSVQQTINGGFIVAGYTWSNDGDVTGFHGGTDYWIVKLDSAGSIQ